MNPTRSERQTLPKPARFRGLTARVELDDGGADPFAFSLDEAACDRVLREGLGFDPAGGPDEARTAAESLSELLRELFESVCEGRGSRAILSRPSHVDQWQAWRERVSRWAESGGTGRASIDQTVQARPDSFGSPDFDMKGARDELAEILGRLADPNHPATARRAARPERGLFVHFSAGGRRGSDASAFGLRLTARHWDAWVRSNPRLAALDVWQIPSAWARQAPLALLGASRCSWSINPMVLFGELRDNPESNEIFPVVGLSLPKADERSALAAFSELFSPEPLPEPVALDPTADWASRAADRSALEWLNAVDAHEQRASIERACSTKRAGKARRPRGGAPGI